MQYYNSRKVFNESRTPLKDSNSNQTVSQLSISKYDTLPTPTEVTTMVFSNLSFFERQVLRLVCKNFRAIVNTMVINEHFLILPINTIPMIFSMDKVAELINKPHATQADLLQRIAKQPQNFFSDMQKHAYNSQWQSLKKLALS